MTADTAACGWTCPYNEAGHEEYDLDHKFQPEAAMTANTITKRSTPAAVAAADIEAGGALVRALVPALSDTLPGWGLDDYAGLAVVLRNRLRSSGYLVVPAAEHERLPKVGGHFGNRPPPPPPPDGPGGRLPRGERSDEDIARMFHEAYERLAPSFGYETRKASAVPWEDVPEPNRSLMVAVAGEVRAALEGSDR